MKLPRLIWMTAVVIGLGIATTFAQDEGGPPPQDGGQGGPPGGRHHRPPPLPIVQALDANHDGVIDASEIANAPAALKTLDKNGDGQLTRDEYLPPHPNGPPPGEQGDQRPPPPPDDN